jgi:hypothetical protein
MNNSEGSDDLNQKIEEYLNLRLKNYQVNQIFLFQLKGFYLIQIV